MNHSDILKRAGEGMTFRSLLLLPLIAVLLTVTGLQARAEAPPSLVTLTASPSFSNCYGTTVNIGITAVEANTWHMLYHYDAGTGVYSFAASYANILPGGPQPLGSFTAVGEYVGFNLPTASGFPLASFSLPLPAGYTPMGGSNVFIHPLPTATIAGDNGVCTYGTSPAITFTGASGTAPYTFTYNINGGSDQTVTTTSGNSVDVYVDTYTPGTYVYNLLSVTDANGCQQSATGSATVVVWDLPYAGISGTTGVCLNGTAPDVTFTASGGMGDYTFSYLINGIGPYTVTTSGSNVATVSHPTGTAGTFTYELLNVTDGHNCFQWQGGIATITVWDLPTATISVVGQNHICINGTANFSIALTGQSPWDITYTSGSVLNTTDNPYLFSDNPTANGNYEVLSVTDGNGCTNSGNSVPIYVGTVTTIQTAAFQHMCVGTEYEIPVTVQNFEDVGSISLVFNYNPAVLQFNGYTDPNGFFGGGILNPIAGTVTAGAYNVGSSAWSLPDNSVLYTVKFIYLGGSTLLTFDSSDPDFCQYYTFSEPVQPFCDDDPSFATYYISGSVDGHPRPTVVVSGDATACPDNPVNVSFTFTGTAPFDLVYTDGVNGNVTELGIMDNPYQVTVPSVPGTYVYTAISLSDDHCTAQPGDISGSATVTIYEAPDADVASTHVTCYGAANGSITISNPTGGSGSYEYSIDGGSSWSINPSFSGLIPGTYPVRIKSSGLGCNISLGTVVITEPDALMVTLGFSPVSCNGLTDGTASAGVTGGTPPYTYLWSDGQTTATATGLAAGTYTVVVSDANGCIQSCYSYLPSQTLVMALGNGADGEGIAYNPNDQLIYHTSGISNGDEYFEAVDPVNLTIGPNLVGGTYGGGASEIFGIAWYPAWNAFVAVDITSGIYSISTSGAMAFVATYSGPEDIRGLAVSGSDVYGIEPFGPTSRLVKFNPNTGVPSYMVDMTLGGVPITGANGIALHPLTGQFYVIYKNGSARHLGIVDPVSGAITDLGNTGKNFAGITFDADGTLYGVTGNGASPAETLFRFNEGGSACSVTVTGPDALTAGCSATPVSCNGGSNGTVSASAVGGNGGYTYLWSNSSTDQSQSGITAGTYSVTITDSKGCSTTCSVDVEEPALLTASCGSEPVSCNGGSDGEASVLANGGNGGYSYIWSNGVTTALVSGLMAGNYNVTVTDNLGCTATCSVEVTEPPVLEANCSMVPVSCYGESNGGASVLATGGNGGYAYIWSNGGTDASISGLVADLYSVTVTDSKGCSSTCSVQVTQPDLLIAGCTSTPVSCFGGSDGTIGSNALGGNGGYMFEWSNGPTTASQTGLSAGWYTVTITDIEGCSTTCSVEVEQPLVLEASCSAQPVSCFNGNDGSAGVMVSGGNIPYTYLWSNMETSSSISGLTAGLYSVTVTDFKGCSSTCSVEVTQPSQLNASCSASEVTCYGGSDGEASVSVGGGTAPYSYEWNSSPVQYTQVATGLISGWYDVLVTDDHGCTTTCNVFVPEPDELYAATSYTDPSCFDVSDGSITFSSPDGGHGTFEVSINGTTWETLVTSYTFSNLSDGAYDLLIRDASVPSCVVDLGDVTLVEPVANPVTFSVKYHNTASTSMSGVSFELKQGGVTKFTGGPTNGSGVYTFPNICPGSYDVYFTTSKPVGGVNAGDAALVNAFGTVPALPVEKVKYYAGDFKSDWNLINATDANGILAYFVNLYSGPFASSRGSWTFWPAGDQFSSLPSPGGSIQVPQITIITGNPTVNFYALVTGDFNRSFTPAAKASGGSIVLQQGAKQSLSSSSFEVPVRAGMKMTVSSVSLIMNYPSDKVEITDVTLSNGQPVMFSTNDDQLVIGWTSPMPLGLNTGDIMLVLHGNVMGDLSDGSVINFTLRGDDLNEITDAAISVIPDAVITVDQFGSALGVNDPAGAASIAFSNYPNPFREATTFAYTLPQSGEVTLEVRDMLGARVATLLDREMTEAGKHTYNLKTNSLAPGVYMVTLTMEANGQTLVKTIKVVRNQ